MLKKLVPKLQVNSIYDIDLNGIWQSGIRGIITDLDNTLVGAKDPSATPERRRLLQPAERIGLSEDVRPVKIGNRCYLVDVIGTEHRRISLIIHHRKRLDDLNCLQLAGIFR